VHSWKPFVCDWRTSKPLQIEDQAIPDV